MRTIALLMVAGSTMLPATGCTSCPDYSCDSPGVYVDIVDPGEATAVRLCADVVCDEIPAPLDTVKLELGPSGHPDSFAFSVELLRDGQVIASATEENVKERHHRCGCGGISFDFQDGSLKRTF